MSEQREDERGVVWAVLIGVVLLAIGLAVGMGLYRTGKNAGQATATASSAGVSAGAATAVTPTLGAAIEQDDLAHALRGLRQSLVLESSAALTILALVAWLGTLELAIAKG